MEDQNQAPLQSIPEVPHEPGAPSRSVGLKQAGMKRFWPILVVGLLTTVFLILMYIGYGSSLDKQEPQDGRPSYTEEDHRDATVLFKDFFPNISGNIGEYAVAIPATYTQYVVPNDLAPGTFLWGEASDIQKITANPDAIAFDASVAGVFRVRFSSGVGVDATGRIADNNGPVTVGSLTKQGMSDVTLREGWFYGIPGAPVVVVEGRVQGKPVRMAYLYSPTDNLVVLVSLQGGSMDDKVNSNIWATFVSSFYKEQSSMSQEQSRDFSQAQLQAIRIADIELLKRVPGKKLEDGQVYVVQSVSGTGAEYTVWYVPEPLTFDRDIKITVDISSGTVITYDQHME